MAKPKTLFEFSAGGVVQDGPNLLMVKVKNLEGRQIWTFPKGHIEKDEKAEEAALREVQEETGYACEIIKPFNRIQYWFKREKQLTKKTVTWFLMKPLQKTGSFDPDEILEIKWVALADAPALASYRSDKQILEQLKGA
jgi:8-oxo-dGTP pyrophosphatase MutT (NUDIX family)